MDTISTALASRGSVGSVVTQSAYYEHGGLVVAVGLFSGHVWRSQVLLIYGSGLRNKVAKGGGVMDGAVGGS